jgi:hypothetical protein
MKVSPLHSQLLNNDTGYFTNCQNIFQQYKMNSSQYVRNNEQLQQSFTYKFVGFMEDTALFRTCDSPLEASY